MDEATPFQRSQGAISSRLGHDPQAADLSALRSVLENHLGRLRDAACRVEHIGDQVFGYRGESLNQVGASSVAAGPASLAELIDYVGCEIARIETALTRL